MPKTEINVINFDLDGTLTQDVCWTPEECLNAKPDVKAVALLEELYKTKIIIIYTARRDFLIEASLKWLRKNSIKFHAISNNKIPGFYIDDNCANIEDLK